jgi:predicted nucleic acid-binding Zn ribbon protein
MYCQKCGKENPDINQFCGSCGENLSKNQQPQVKKGRKKRLGKLGLIVGLLSIFFGVSIILYINIYPVTEIMGQGLTLAQMDSSCQNFVVAALSKGTCDIVHTEFYAGWVIAIILIFSGLLEVIFG